MTINKFQRSILTFDPGAKVANIGNPSKYQSIVFSETLRPIELKFQRNTPYDKLAKIYANCSGHISKMADIPIYDKNPVKYSTPEP